MEEIWSIISSLSSAFSVLVAVSIVLIPHWIQEAKNRNISSYQLGWLFLELAIQFRGYVNNHSEKCFKIGKSVNKLVYDKNET